MYLGEFMEKYGVDIAKSKDVKEASINSVCPVCGQELQKTNPPTCDKHGTKPFEALLEQAKSKK